MIEENSTEDMVMTKSVVLTAKGSFNNVTIADWSIPSKCTSKQVKIAVDYCGINFADVYHVLGRLIEKPAPYVLGLECVGVINELGAEVTDFKLGERVACYKPDTGLFRHIVIVDENQCHHIPQEICSRTACALLANYLTAYFALTLGHLRPGQSVLIHSAAGGVGWAATQLASKLAKGLTVFGTSSSSKHDDIVRNGITTPLTYSNYADHISKTGVDIIIDNIGGDNLQKSIELLSPLGRVIVTGANSVVHEDNVKADKAMERLIAASSVPLHNLVTGNKAVCGLHLGTLQDSSPNVVKQAVQHLFKLCQKGIIKPRIHTVLPFNQVSDAIKILAERRNIGKVLIQVN